MHENWIATHQLTENIVFGLTRCLKNQLLTNRMQKSALQTTPVYWKIHIDETQYFENDLYKVHICK